MTIEISGLSLYTRHGVSEAERELGQRLAVRRGLRARRLRRDGHRPGGGHRRLRQVCEQVALAAQERSYKTLERLCSAVADRLMDRFGAESVRVKAAKPEPPIPLPVDEVSVEVWKEA